MVQSDTGRYRAQRKRLARNQEDKLWEERCKTFHLLTHMTQTMFVKAEGAAVIVEVNIVVVLTGMVVAVSCSSRGGGGDGMTVPTPGMSESNNILCLTLPQNMLNMFALIMFALYILEESQVIREFWYLCDVIMA